MMKAKRVSFVYSVIAIGLFAAGLKGQAVNLTDLTIEPNRETGKVAPDKDKDRFLLLNKTSDGKPLAIGEKTYTTGLIAYHGSLSWSYELNGEYTSLVTDLGGEGNAAVRVLGMESCFMTAARFRGRAI